MSTLIGVPAPLPRAEETANCATHALGFVLSLVGTVALLRLTAQYGDRLQMVGVAVYGATLMALYGASTLSHSFERPRLRHFFRTVDQVCIFLLIAGTYTPISLTYLREGWWWALFVSVWGLALAGIFVKIFYARLKGLNVSAYVFLGWLPVIAIRPIVAAMPGVALAWIVAGGIFYTLGTLFLMRDERVPLFHAVWHLFVIAGSACHYVAVLRFVMP
jgi:hemolysin III